ncbi:MAG TPA: site-specific integrase [Solirubrobacteraceae bacterium]
MGSTTTRRGYLVVRQLKGSRTRVYYAYWRDADGSKHGRRLGLAHVRDTGRRTARGAVVWRAGDGPKPTPGHLTPQDAQAELQRILGEAQEQQRSQAAASAGVVLWRACDAWLSARMAERELKRSTVADYEDMFERLYRDLGADTPIGELADGRLRGYFAGFQAERLLGEQGAQRAREAGLDVVEVEVVRFTAQPPGSQAFEVATLREAQRLAARIGGRYKHRARGCYRVTALGAQRPKRVSRSQARIRESEGWVVAERRQPRCMLRSAASAQTRNKYRDILAAVFDHAIGEGRLQSNPLAAVRRASSRQARLRVLRRDDFYEPSEVARLLEHAPGIREEAFWLCGAHAGLRLPGEALGLRWGAVDFHAGVIRVYDNWVRNAPETSKTATSAAIPMTPRLTQALASLKELAATCGEGDFVFASDLPDRPVAEQPIRQAFKDAQQRTGLKAIRMYNLRHSFGTGLARAGVDLRTIQALMRHTRLSTTEQYLAYAPQPDLAHRLTQALDPPASPIAARELVLA